MAFLFPLLVKRKWFLICFSLGALPLFFDPPSGLTPEGFKVLSIAGIAILLFITEPIPLPTVALLIAVLQVLFQIGTPTEVAKSFMSDSVFFIMGSLMLAVAIVKQKLDKRIALAILRITGPSVYRITFGFVIVSALIASVAGEHTVTAMMLPVVITLITFTSTEPQNIRNLSILLLLSIAYGAMIAGFGTPSGGARNAIMIAYFRHLFDIRISYLTWIGYLYPLLFLQVPFVTYLLYKTFKPEVQNLQPAISQLKEKVKGEGKLTDKDRWTIAIFLFTMLLWITVSDQIGLGITALIGVFLYLLFDIVKWEDLNNGINWGVILIYASAISLGISMKDTGAANWLANALLGWLTTNGAQNDLLILGMIAIITMAIASFISSGAAVGMLGPITLELARLGETSIIAAGLITVMASSFSFMTAVASPASQIVLSSGYIRKKDFLKGGWKITLVSLILLLLYSQTYWKLVNLPQ
ncbi:MAG TPA: DASS family sodium-coupled anion symporter [Nitrospiria bacterium]|jgi:sodium-dependent dicarboxylate transporter 2/3/5